ncbi:NADH dehydrogenase [ubiquinone] 1 alpha subcomplex subunit 10 [Anaeramoeba flamelloides]|uniref:NADH dehydrogenase [ubiquinone] 1 alpha subcomplex subunit 10 n=1 Tax=Anaeramoeba flamelloides TaxID=1746091 RepID=A0ABQ8X7P5_9EUKA|nr:NADH dehydrogenase [ubiquinone] 1 alpha subcomplex subunit 10 [Anaeramoeba flamelloides]
MSLIICEGNICAGKTTLVKELARRLNYQAFFEPTATNPYLERYYQNREKWALTMQLFLLRQRFMTYINCLEHIESGKVKGAILDRSLFSDWVFAKKNYDDGFINEQGWELYNSIRNEMVSLIPIPQITLFLDVPSKICYDRIHNLRGRKCESGIPLDYLLGLEERYLCLLEELEQWNSVVIKVDWTQFGCAGDILKTIIKTICPEIKTKIVNKSSVKQGESNYEPNQLKTLWSTIIQKFVHIFDFKSYPEFKEVTKDTHKLRKVLKVDQDTNLSQFLKSDF